VHIKNYWRVKKIIKKEKGYMDKNRSISTAGKNIERGVG